MNLTELQEMWKSDCMISDDLGYESVRGPILHSRYIDELITAKLKHTKLTHEVAELKATKAKYFRGELSKEELDARGWKQWQYRSLKSDIPDMIDADPDYQKLMARESYMRTMIYFLESVMGEIKNRNWAIRTSMDWIKFRAGA
jgi:hypothetical protein